MKLFGEFLLSKKVINEDQLLSALLMQVKQQPSLCEAAKESGAINTQALLSILGEQTRKKVGFIEAAKSLNLWTDALLMAVEDRISKSTTPLGKVLADQGVLNWETISKFLDEFWGELDESEVKRPASVAQATSTISAPSSGSISSAAVEHYLETFTETKRIEIENFFNFIGSWTAWGVADQQIILQSAKAKIHFLQGAARLAGASQSESIFLAMEDCLEKLSSNSGNWDATIFVKFTSAALAGLNGVWKFRSKITTDGETSAETVQEASSLKKAILEGFGG